MGQLAIIGLKALGIGKRVFAWALDHPWQIACAVLLALWLITRGDLHEEQATSARLSNQVAAEKTAHQKTKDDYRAAQAQAAKLEAQRLARVKAEQQEITDERVASYDRRIADARAYAEQLRKAGKAGTQPAGSGAGLEVPGAGDAAGRADPAPAGDQLSLPARTDLDWRLIATEQAIQLDELITWIERQAKVRVNEEPAP